MTSPPQAKPGSIAPFLEQAGLAPDLPVEVRRIGTSDDMVSQIIERIVIGEKTMTYSLPWLREREGRRTPEAGLMVVALDANDNPAILFQLTEVREMKFGEVRFEDIQREGIPMRDIKTWGPLHEAIWNDKLSATGKTVNADMPVCAEYFDLLHASGAVSV